MSDKLRNEARVLAIMAMQSDRYSKNVDFRDQVDKVYGIVDSAPPSDAAPRTERMDLHDELDKRFPLFEDFREFTNRPKRHTNHSIPCPTCGDYWADEDERPEDAPEGPWEARQDANGLWYVRNRIEEDRLVDGMEAETETIAVRDALNRLKGEK